MFQPSNHRRSPSYLVRNQYSYCFRMNVPRDLQPYVGKKELRYSLKTGYLSVAKPKARLLAGLCQNLFNDIRMNGLTLGLKKSEILRIVNTTIRTFLEYSEAHRLVGAKELDFSSRQAALSNLSDSMGVGLPSTETVFPLNDLSSQAQFATKHGLVDADYTKYERTIQTLIKLHELDVEKGSVEYMQLSREFLKVYNQWAKVEDRRNQNISCHP